MHELSIVQSLLEIAESEARKRDSVAVIAIKLRLGEFTGVAREALEFAFAIARQGTLAESASLIVESVPLRATCPTCGLTVTPPEDFCLRCTACGGPLEILSGREMEIEYLELEEAAAPPG